MSFGFNSSDSSNQSQGTSLGFGETIGQSSGFSGGEQGSQGSTDSWDYGNNVWGPQAGFLQNLWGQGSNLLDQGGGQQGAQQLHGQGVRAIMQGLNPGYLNAAGQTVQNQTNPNGNPMLDVYAKQIGQQFGEQVLPQLRGGAAMAGGMGSSRQGIAEGLAAARSEAQLQDFGAQLYDNEQNRALNAASLGAIIFCLAAGMVPQMGTFGMNIPWFNLQQQAGLLGGPIMQDLGGYSTGSQSSYGSNYGEQSASNYGYNYDTAQNTSSGDSSSFGIGISEGS